MIKIIKGDIYEETDWEKVLSMIGIHQNSSELTFEEIINNKIQIQSAYEQIKKFNSSLIEEINIRNTLKEIIDWNENCTFQIAQMNLEDNSIIYIIIEQEELLQTLEDYYLSLKIIADSKYKNKYLNNVQVLENSFEFKKKCLNKLFFVQKKFIYLDPIMNRNKLEKYDKIFIEIKQKLIYIFNQIEKTKKINDLKNIANLEQVLQNLIENLEEIQFQLNKFLEKKRSLFPRLYFLGDEDLLELLGHAQNALILETHIKKLFTGFHHLIVNQKNQIIQIQSEDVYKFPETLDIKPLELNSNIIENILNNLQEKIILVLQNSNKTIKNSEFPPQKLFDNLIQSLKNPGQILLLNQEIVFTNLLLEARKVNSFQNLKENYQTFLKLLTSFRKTEDLLLLTKIKHIIMETIKKIRILEEMNNYESSWQWFKILKYFYNNGQIQVESCEFSVPYLWEYQGNKPILVYTPLTEKCFITFYQSMRMTLGCNLTGPAGTGKTETIKALGGALGKQVLVFNCDENIDYKSLEKIFKGLLQVGSWGCFDEFNRLSVQKLSTISQTIQNIQFAMREHKSQFSFDGLENINLNFNAGIYITMNPSSQEYGGRSQLPQNLKNLFRVVNVSVPDDIIIIEVILYSEGFQEYQVLGRKLLDFLNKCRENFSKQKFYDWSLRKIKSILLTAGDIYQANQQNQIKCILKAININIQSKLVKEDVEIFEQNLKEYFQDSEKINEENNNEKSAFLEDILREKLNQLNELLKRRTGVLIFGKNGTFKSSLIQTYFEMNKEKTKKYHINPKSLERSCFLGKLDNNTNKFKDGILTKITREILKQYNPSFRYLIIIDSEIDPEWIEALNSVLDDNRLLTLPSGERLQYYKNVNIIFEARKLDFASPATISRMGLINMDNFSIPQNFLDFQLNSLKDQQDSYKTIFEYLNSKNLDLNNFDLARNYINSQNFENNNLDQFMQSIMFVSNEQCKNDFKEKFGMIFNDKLKEDLQEDFNQLEKNYLSNLIATIKNVFILHKNQVQCKYFIDEIIQQQITNKIQLIQISCTYNIKSEYFINILKQQCVFFDTGTSFILSSKNNNSVLIQLENFQAIGKDQYEDVQFYELIHMMINYKFFYDSEGNQIFLKNFFFLILIDQNCFELFSKHYKKLFSSGVIYQINSLKEDLNSIPVDQYLQKYTLQQNFNQYVKNNFNTLFQKLYIQIQSLKNDTSVPLFIKNKANSLQIYEILESSKFFNKSSEEEILFFLQLGYEAQILIQLGNQSQFIEQTQQNELNQKTQLFISYPEKKYKLLPKKEFNQNIKKCLSDYWRDQYFIFNFNILKNHKQLLRILEYILLTQKNKNILLIGKPGQGKKSLLCILSQKLEFKIKIFPYQQNIKEIDFQKLFLNCLNDIFIEGQKIMLIIQEIHIKKSEFFDVLLRFIEKQEIQILTQEEIEFFVKNDQERNQSSLDINSYFQNKIISNLSVIFILNETQIQFQEMLINYPSLSNSMKIVNMNNLTNKSNYNELLKKKLKIKISDQQLDQIVNIIYKLESENFYQIVSLCEDCLQIEKRNKNDFETQINRLKEGLSKITSASNFILILRKEAKETEEKVKQKQDESQEYLKKIEQIYTSTNQQREKMLEEDECLVKEEKQILIKKNQVELQLADVLPIIEKAKAEVSSISKKHLSELKNLPKPPDKIVHVMGALLKMLGYQKTDWSEIKKFLGQSSIIEDILNFDAKKMSEDLHQSMVLYIQQYQDSFETNQIYRASKAAGPISEYIKALLKLKDTYLKIKPLEQNLEYLEDQLLESKKKLEQQKQELSTVDQNISNLKKDFISKTGEAEKLKKSLEDIQNNINKANILMNSLGEENERWKISCNDLEENSTQIQLKSFLAAFEINFHNNKKYEQNILRQLQNILEIKDFDFEHFICSPNQLLNYFNFGLPKEKKTIFQTLSLINSSKIPFIIDPFEEILGFLQNFTKQNQLICTLGDKSLCQKVETSLKFGVALFIVDINEELPMFFVNLIKKNYRILINSQEIEIMGKKVTKNQNFVLYFATKEENNVDKFQKHYKAYLNIINNVLNEQMLENKFLNLIIEQKNPELLKKKLLLLEQEKINENKLLQLEDDILQKLKDCKEDILYNDELVNQMKEAKIKSSEIKKSIENSNIEKAKMIEYQQNFQNSAHMITQIYVCIKNFQKLNYFYTFSLNFFQEVVQKSFGEFSEIENLDFDDIFSKILFKNLLQLFAISFFNEDFNLFAISLLKIIKPTIFSKKDWQILKTLDKDVIDNKSSTNKPPYWIESYNFSAHQIFSDEYREILYNFNSNELWKKWFQLDQCEKKWPKIEEFQLSDVQKLLILKIYREDRFIIYIKKFIFKCSGVDINFLSYQPIKKINISQSNKQPILFMIKEQSDPSVEIEQIIQKNSKENILQLICGNITEEEILQKIEKNPNFIVILKNLHLSPKITLKISHIYSHFKENQSLILTTEQNSFFSNSFLSSCFKIACEKTEGIQKGMQRIYVFVSSFDLQLFSPNHSEVIFKLGYLHCVVTEREQFVPQTWKKNYGFSQNDFLAAYDCLKFLKKNQTPNFMKIFQQLLKECFYGSKVDCKEDQKVLGELIELIFDKGHKFLPKLIGDDHNSHFQAINELKPLKESMAEYFVSNKSLGKENSKNFTEKLCKLDQVNQNDIFKIFSLFFNK